MTPNAKIWDESLDPSDTVDFEIDCSDLLQPGELIASYTLNLPAESLLYNLQLGTGQYAATRNGSKVRIWLSVNSEPEQPVTLPVEITITTNSVPPRIKQRTAAVRVEQL